VTPESDSAASAAAAAQPASALCVTVPVPPVFPAPVHASAPGAVPCLSCGLWLASGAALDAHAAALRPVCLRARCPVAGCGTEPADLRAMRQHLAAAHPGIAVAVVERPL
jgi:hypothetical protein